MLDFIGRGLAAGDLVGSDRSVVFILGVSQPLQPSNHVMIYRFKVAKCVNMYLCNICSFSLVFSLLLYFTSLSLFLSLNIESSYVKDWRLLQCHNRGCEVR